MQVVCGVKLSSGYPQQLTSLVSHHTEVSFTDSSHEVLQPHPV